MPLAMTDAGPSSSGPFDITTLPGYLDRWRSDTIGLGNGASIPSWTSVGGTRTLTQGTGSKQPTYTTNALNGLGVAHFASASSQLLTMTDFSLGTVHTVYALLRRSGTPSSPVVGSSSGTVYAVFVDAATAVYYREGGGALMTGTAIADATWVICSVVRSGTAVTLFQDNTQTGSGTLGVGTNILNFGALGGSGTTGGHNGDIADVILCTSTHSASDRANAVSALQGIWGAV